MGFIKPADGKRRRARILPPTGRQAFPDAESAKVKRSIVYDIILFPFTMALLIAFVSPEPLPLTPMDPSVSWPKSVCSLGWCNCTRINEVPSTAELAAVSYGRRGYNYLDVLRPVVVKDGLKVVCNCTSGQEVDFDHHSLPPETLEVEVQGCAKVNFKPGSLSRPTSLTSLLIRSSAQVSFNRSLYIPTGYHYTSPAAYSSSRDIYRSLHHNSNLSDSSIDWRSTHRTQDGSSWRRVARAARPSTRSSGIRVPQPRETLLDVSDAQSVLWESGAFRTVLGGGSVPSIASQGAEAAAAAISAVHPRPPLSVRLHRVGHALVNAASFGRLSTFHASEVQRLELREYAFSVESAPAILASLEGSPKNGPLTTQVFLRGVTIPSIPRHAFPSSATEVHLESSEVRAVRRDAFSALTFSEIYVSDSALREVESGAFSGRTLCQRLTFHRVRVGKLSRNAVHSAVNRLSVSHSWIKEVGVGAFNLTVASAAITDNVFEVARTRGFSLRDWDRVTLHNNTFLRLEPGSFSGLVVSNPGPNLEGQEDAYTSSSSSTFLQVYSLNERDLGSEANIDQGAAPTTDGNATELEDPAELSSRGPRRHPHRYRRFASRSRELNITDNVFGETPVGSLSLLPFGRIDNPSSEEDEQRPVAMTVADNRFRYGCRCGMIVWLKGLTEDGGTNEETEGADEEEPSPRTWSRSLYNTSMCLVDSELARCFNVSVGFMRMRDFAILVCPFDKETGEEKEGGPSTITCDAEEENPAVHKAVVVVVPDTAAGAGGVDVSNVDIGDVGGTENELERDKKILNTIFVAVVICICVIVLVTWVRRTQWWKRVRERSHVTEAEGEDGGGEACWVWAVARMRVLMMSPVRRANGTVVGAGAEEEDGISGADSITRLSVEGYNEMMEREAEENGTAGKKSLRSRLGVDQEGSGLLMQEGEEEEDGASDIEDVEREDKATQTMPEELTHELLMALREKLDDPENYSEARDMIEHLYDIIKVEEEREMEEKRREASRRARSVATDDEEDDDEEDDEEDNLYDVIQPRPQSGTGGKAGRRRRGRHREATTYNSVGTRAPSPDKLEPVLTASASLASLASIASMVSPLGSPMPQRGTGGVARKRRPAPKAPAVCEYVEPKDRAQHVYTELPLNGVAEASDPRPPRLRLKDEQSAGQASASTSQNVDKAPDPPPPPSVPFKFLRALGETFLTPNKPPRAPPPPAQKAPEARAKSNGGIVCEYTEPTDARVHVYTELPLSSGQANASPSSTGQGQLPASMANRPLPHKPDSPDTEGPKPSASFASR